MDVMRFVRSFRPKRISALLWTSVAIFIVFVTLDFFTTTIVANGDASMEGNLIARWWWEVMGVFRHIDIPIWIGYILLMAWIFNMKSEFIALWWVNGIAFGHFLGWSSWLPGGNTRYLYETVHQVVPLRAVYDIPLGAFGMFFGLLLAILMIRGRKLYFEYCRKDV